MTSEKLTWEKLVEAQPLLKELYDDAGAVKDTGGRSFCANRIWYQGGLRNRLIEIVGWMAPKALPDFVRTQEAYDLAYQKVYKVLPYCRNCMCL